MASQRCGACGEGHFSIDPARGQRTCVACGAVNNDVQLTTEFDFGALGGGVSARPAGGGWRWSGRLSGQLGARSAVSRAEQLDERLNSARLRMREVCQQMRITGVVECALEVYKRPLVEKNTRLTRRMLAACIYAACRIKRKQVSLTDFARCQLVRASEDDEPLCELKQETTAIGRTYADLCKEYHLDVPSYDPSANLERLIRELGVRDRAQVEQVSQTAVGIAQQMQRKWISVGRRPAGIAAVAVYCALKQHGYTTVRLGTVARRVAISPLTALQRVSELLEAQGMSEQEAQPAALTRSETLRQKHRRVLREQGDAPPPAFVSIQDLRASGVVGGKRDRDDAESDEDAPDEVAPNCDIWELSLMDRLRVVHYKRRREAARVQGETAASAASVVEPDEAMQAMLQRADAAIEAGDSAGAADGDAEQQRMRAELADLDLGFEDIEDEGYEEVGLQPGPAPAAAAAAPTGAPAGVGDGEGSDISVGSVSDTGFEDWVVPEAEADNLKRVWLDEHGEWRQEQIKKQRQKEKLAAERAGKRRAGPRRGGSRMLPAQEDGGDWETPLDAVGHALGVRGGASITADIPALFSNVERQFARRGAGSTPLGQDLGDHADRFSDISGSGILSRRGLGFPSASVLSAASGAGSAADFAPFGAGSAADFAGSEAMDDHR